MPPTKTITKTIDYRRAFADLGYEFAFNDITQAIEVNGQEFHREKNESKIICQMREKGAYKETVVLREIEYAAGENSYNPIKKYLSGLPYDGKDYIGELCSFFHADQYFERWLRRWLVMAVARAMNGAQCPVLIIDGPQNSGKSKFVQWLCSSPKVKGYYTEGQISPDSKDARVRATEKWIWEVPEFGATARRADVEALKGFITLSEITERAPYQRKDQKRPMLACFIGTINNGVAGFLTDPSGSRRFLITHVESINWQGYITALNPDQIWGQACAEYTVGEPSELTQDDLKLLAINNSSYEVTSPLQAVFESIFEIEQTPKSFTTTFELLDAIQNSGYRAGTTNALSRELTQLLTKLGAQKARQRVKNMGNPVMGYLGIRRII